MSIEDGFGKHSGISSGDGNGRPGNGTRGSRAAGNASRVSSGARFRKEDDLDEGYLDDDYEDDDFDELDLFDDVSIGTGNDQDDAEIAEDLDMENKLLGQAMSPQNGKRAQADGGRDRDGFGAGFGTGTSGKKNARNSAAGGRKGPRELNTPGSTVDQRQLKREKEQKKRSRIKKAIIWAVVEVFTLCLIFGYGYILRTFSLMNHPNVSREAVENPNLSVEKKKEMEGYWNFYIFGVDNRDERVNRGNSDVIMIASINQDTGDIKLVSVFRDTYLNINSNNAYAKINQAYASGGPEQAIAALNKNLDLNITNYVTVNWEAVAHGINILGGIDDVDISNAEFYYINAFITETVKSTGIGSHQLKSPGKQHLDGVQCVAYGRLRLMDSDFARSERQREIIEKLFAKAKTADFAVLNNILVDCFPMVAIDIPFEDLVRMAQGISRYNIVDTGGFPWSRGDANIPGKGSLVVPTTLESNVIKLHAFLFGDESYQPSEAVLRYSQKIKEDSNLYKEGTPIESVGTDNGVIQKPKTSAASEEEDEEDEELDETKKQHGTKEYETDEDGNYILPTDEDGEVILPTDEDGNEIVPTRPERPSSLADETTEGDAGSELVDDNGNVIGTSPRPSETARPSQSTDTTRPGDTGHTVNPTHSVNPTQSEETTHGVNPDGTGGSANRPTETISDEPAVIEPTQPTAHVPSETTAQTPGGTVIAPTNPEPTANSSGPGGNSNSNTPGGEVSVIAPDGGAAVGPGV
ncbi:MAG: LCP family protein [Eubacteriales bacterium]|nr:LCP family protein [Eubacteriales bacterium]